MLVFTRVQKDQLDQVLDASKPLNVVVFAVELIYEVVAQPNGLFADLLKLIKDEGFHLINDHSMGLDI